MFSSSLWNWLNQMFQRSGRGGKPRQWTRQVTLLLEPLEQRVVPSIVWINRDSDTTFQTYYQGDADKARAVVDAAIADWNNVIRSFNYRNIGQPGWAPKDEMDLTITAGVLTDNHLGETYGNTIQRDGDGKPYAATITFDQNAENAGWYFDPTPTDNAEFGRPSVTPFMAAANIDDVDFMTVVEHEIGHAVGITDGGDLGDKLVAMPDPYFTLPAPYDHLYSFTLSDGTKMTFTSSAHVNGKFPVPSGYAMATDLMNADQSRGFRDLISDLDAEILRDAYGYTVTLPSELPFGNFLSVYNSKTGQLTVNADPTTKSNLIVVDANPATQAVEIQVNGDAWSYTGVTSVVVNGSLASDASDTVRIQATLSGVKTTVNSGRGSTQILVVGQLNETSVDNVQTVAGAVEIVGGINTSLDVNDSTYDRGRTVTITKAGISGLAPGGITYDNQIKSIELHGGNGGNTFDIQSLDPYTPLTIDAGGGGDAVTIGDATAFVGGDSQDFAPPAEVTVDGDAGTTVTLDDEAYTDSAPTYQVTSTGVTRLATPPGQSSPNTTAVLCSGVGQLLVHGGNNQNIFDVTGTPSGTEVTLLAGSDSDQVNVGDPANGLYQIGTLNVQGGAGTTLDLNDEGTQNDEAFVIFKGDSTQLTAVGHSPSFDVTDSGVTYTDHWTLTDQTVTTGFKPHIDDSMTGTSVGQISYSKITKLTITGTTIQPLVVRGETLDTGSTASTFNIESTSVPVTLTAGNGGDAVNVGTAEGLLEDVGQVTVNGGTGTTLEINDLGNIPVTLQAARQNGWGLAKSTNPQYVISDSLVTRNDTVVTTDVQSGRTTTTHPNMALTYLNVTSLVIDAGPSDDNFNVKSTMAGTPVTISTDGGINTVAVAPDTQDLSNLKDDLTIQGSSTGQTSVSVYDQNNPGSTTPPTPVPVQDSYRIKAGGLCIGDPVNLNLSNVAALALYGATSAAYDVEALPIGTEVTINPGAGTSIYNPTAFSLLGSGLNFSVAGTDLVLDDSASTADTRYSVTDSAVQIDNLPAISYSGAHSITVVGGSGNNTFNVQSTAVNNGTAIIAGPNINYITIAMGKLASPVGLNGAAGTTQVAAIAPPGSNVLGLTSTQLTGAGETINFNLGTTLSSLTIDGSAGINQLQVQGTPPAPLTLTDMVVATTTSATVSAASPLLGETVIFTASVSATIADSGTPSGSVDFFDSTTNTDLGTAPVINGTASLTTAALGVGDHTITATYGGDATFLSSAGSTSLRVLAPASLSGLAFEDFNDDGQVDFGEQGIVGVAISLTGTDDLGHDVNLALTTDADGAYIFRNLRPGNYTISETQPAGYGQGIDSVGTAGGTTANDQFLVSLAAGINGLNYNYGEQPPAGGGVQKGQTAGIGFWNNKNGQALIKALNGGTGHQLGDWLAATLPHMYGTDAGTGNLAGKSNAYIAALFQSDFVLKGVKLDAQVLATALSVYVTNATLDPPAVAAQYGFTVSGDGVGTAAVNVGSNGDAFGVANNTTLTVMDLLLATDAEAVNGVLYNGNSTKRSEANTVYSGLNQTGGIN